MNQGLIIEWLQDTFELLLKTPGSRPAYSAPILMAHDMLRAKETQGLVVGDSRIVEFITAKGKKRGVVALYDSPAGLYQHTLSLLSSGVSVEAIPKTVAEPLWGVFKGGRNASRVAHTDFLLEPSYNQGYEGSRWRSVRRAKNKSKASLSHALLHALPDALMGHLFRLNKVWVDAKRKKERVSWQGFDGDKTSQVVWVLNNRQLLLDAGVPVLVTWHELGGVPVSYQLFCPFTATDIYCFTRRYDAQYAEQHFIYAEMDEAIRYYGGKQINDGWGGGELTTMKTRYSDKTINSLGIWV